MAIAYAIVTGLFIALVMFWLVRAVVTLTIKDPQAGLTIWLQKSFLSLGLASGSDMIITVLVYTAIAVLGFCVGFPMAAIAIMGYMVMHCVQWLYATTEVNQQRLNEILLSEELCAEAA
jgi:hypothetical protein